MNAPSTKMLYSRRRIADLCDVSLRTVDRLLETGQLKALRVGRRRLVSDDELRKFIKKAARES